MATTLGVKPFADPTKEYIGGGSFGAFLTTSGVMDFIQALPQYVDAAKRKAGPDVYKHVARDPVVSANLKILVALIFSEGIRWETPMEAPQPATFDGEVAAADQTKFDTVKAVQDRFEAELAAMNRPLRQSISEAARGMFRDGLKVCENVFADDPLGLRLTGVKPKKRERIVLYVDQIGNFVGALPANGFVGIPSVTKLPNGASGAPASIDVTNPQIDLLIPAEKFLILTHEEEDGDINGHSLLDAVYDWWFIKTQVLPALLKYLVQFGGPSLILTAGDNAQDEPILDAKGEQKTDPASGEPLIQSAVQKLFQAGLQFFGGSLLALDHGATAETLFAGGNGEAFINTLRYLIDVEITQAMLGSSRAVQESQHGSKADTSGGKDILDIIVEYYRNYFEAALDEGLSKAWTRLNYGEQNVWMAPKCALGAPPQEDLGTTATAFSTLINAGAVPDEHWAWWFAKIGAPSVDIRAFLAKKQAVDDAAALAAQESAKALDPTHDVGAAA
jgi:hypothetical protein